MYVLNNDRIMNLTDNDLKLPALQVHWLQRMQFCPWFGYAQPFYKYIPWFKILLGKRF